MFIEKLDKAIENTRSLICLGLDPFIELMPEDWLNQQKKGPHGQIDELTCIRHYFEKVLEIAAGRVPVVKPQSAFFEAYGAAGMALFEDLVEQAKKLGFLVIADVKRGDIGTTAEAYAKAYFPLVDAVTLNPYMGADAIFPFIEKARQSGGGVFILVRTSNPSAIDFQDIQNANGQPLYESVAAQVHSWGQNDRHNDLSLVGAVVGATWPQQGKRLREIMPHTPFLIPGYGAQGGSVEGVEACCRPHESHRGVIVNSSRGLLYAWKRLKTSDWPLALSKAIDQMNQELSPIMT